MNSEGTLAHKKIVFRTLIGLLFLPWAAFFSPMALNAGTREWIVRHIGFVANAAAQTIFPDAALLYYCTALILLPMQYAIVIWYALGIPKSRLASLQALYKKNDPVIKFGGWVVFRRKWGLPIGCIVFTAALLFFVFEVGVGYHSCQRCLGNTKLGFLAINTGEVLTVLIFAALFILWARLFSNNLGPENAD